MVAYIWVALGGALGTTARYWLSGVVARSFGETFPWGTLIINVTGSFAIGFFGTLTGPDGRLFVRLDQRDQIKWTRTWKYPGTQSCSEFSSARTIDSKTARCTRPSC